MQTLGDSESRFLFDYNPIHSREPIVWALWLWVDCWYPSRVHHTYLQEASFFWDTDYSYLFPVGTSNLPGIHSFLLQSLNWK